MISNLKTRAYRHIRQALLEGELGEGNFLSPAKLAEKIGVSDTPVREAIIQLESEGLVERVPKFGIRARTLSRQELEEMFDLRVALESGAAKLAARRITDEHLARLQDICRQHLAVLKEVRTLSRNHSETFLQNQAWQGPLMEKLAKLNALFHLGVLGASQNQRLIKIVTDLHILGRVLRGRILLPGETALGRLSQDYRFHRRILRALEHHNQQEVFFWVEKHVTEAREYHLAVYDWQHRTRSVDLTGHEWSDELMDSIRQMETDVGVQTSRSDPKSSS
jgi:DNA-binding GntR family transcriptional regulator